MKLGDYVRIRDTAANFAGAVSRVVSDGEATYEVEVVGYTGTFLPEHLERLEVTWKLERQRTYRVVDDPLRMPWDLNAVVKEFETEGYEVRRAFGGTVFRCQMEKSISYRVIAVSWSPEELSFVLQRAASSGPPK